MSANPKLSKSPSWQELFAAVLVETNREKLVALVVDAETAILLRWGELPHTEENHEERAALDLAAQQLLKIKREKLDAPTLKPKSSSEVQPTVVDKLRRVESIHHWRR